MEVIINKLEEHLYEMLHEEAMLKEKRNSACWGTMYDFYDSLVKCAENEIAHTEYLINALREEQED